MDRDSKRRHKHGHHSRRRSRSPRRHRRKSPPRQRTQHRKRSSSSLRSPEPEYYRRASWIVGRSRTRSPHPWIKILEGKESPKHQDDDPDTQLFWDGFQWVARSHALTGNMNRFLEETNKAKRVAISNIPFEFNITEKDVLDFITSKMFEFSLNDSGNKKPVVSVQADEEKPNQVIVQFSSLDEAKKAIRLGGIKLLGRPLSVGKPEEIAGKAGMGQMLGVNTHILDHLDSVETSARAAAVAASAIQGFQTSQQSELFFPHAFQQNTQTTRILKVYGFLDPLEAYKMKEPERVDIEQDMHQEFTNRAPVTYCRFIRPEDVKLGAEWGSIFLEFADWEGARAAKMGMLGKRYDEKEIKVVDVPEDVFYTEIITQSS